MADTARKVTRADGDRFPKQRESLSTTTYWGRKLQDSLQNRRMNARTSFRGGMQVHAVPEAERAFDASGQRLPWAYEYADPDRGSRLSTHEKGPFGRSTRRRTPSRSKTGTPSRKEDRDQAENWKVIDDIFTRAKENEQNKESQRSTATGGAVASGADTTGQPSQATPAGQPSEVILYGFPAAFQYAVIEFYERVSQGTILEDYDRFPANTKYDLSLSLRQSRGATKLSKEALLKKNHYHGGEHWIKVTFDSAEAAERACYYAPHVIKGYLIHAERYRGVGPAMDEAILATKEAVESATASPSQRSSSTMQQQQVTASSETATSATATATVTETLPDPFTSTAPVTPRRSRSAVTSPLGVAPPLTPGESTSTAVQKSSGKTPRIRGAKRTTLLPAEEALLPASSRWQRLFGGLFLIGLLFGGGNDIIGDSVPRDANGDFDKSKAGLYWLFWHWLDSVLPTDFCGLKGDD